MSSGNKKKADLVALFRLEFYRKQSNWKFCGQVQKAKKAASTDKATSTAKIPKNKHVERSLNTTYNVETGKDAEKSFLNQAFLETDDDKSVPSPQNLPETPTKDSSLKIIRITDKWSPPACASLNDTVNIYPNSEKPASPNDLNITETVDGVYQIWPEETDTQILSPPRKDQNWEPFWPYPTQNQNQNDLDIKYLNTLQDKYDENNSKLTQNWLLPEIKYIGQENNYQNCQSITKEQNWPEIIKNWPINESKVMQNWANIMTQNNDKQVEINNNNIIQNTDWPKNKIPEPVFANVHDWKEAKVAEMAQNLQQNWPDDMWQKGELPEMDKEGQEGTEAEWPWDTQIQTNNQLFPEVIWSDDVLRELELLNMNDLGPDEPPEGEKWVPPDRLLQWMLANKECCDSVLEASCESLEQFMRAAHCAPHSSEIDLQPQLDSLEASLEACPTVGVGGADVGQWSWAALRAAGRGHARALRRVARELRARERIVGDREMRSYSVYPATPTPRYDVSCEEYPTRDIGLQQPAFVDTFVSGSYKNNPNNKLLEKNKDSDEKSHDYHANEGPIHMQGGRIVVRGKNGERGESVALGHKERNMGQVKSSWGQTEPNKGRVSPNWGEIEPKKGQVLTNWGQTEPNKNQVLPNWGQIDPKRCKTAKLRVQGDQIVIDQTGITPDQSQIDLGGQIGQWGGFGDHEVIGRGRGRLLHKDNKTSAGRGRGRL